MSETTEQTYRVVLVDDHAIFRSGLRADLAADLQIVGEAGSVEQAIEVIERKRPDVVLLDVHLPGGRGGGGAEVLASCAHLLPDQVPGTERFGLGAGRGAGNPLRCARVRHQKRFGPGDLGCGTPGGRGRRGVLPAPCRLRARRLRLLGGVGQIDEQLDLLTDRELQVMRLIARATAIRKWPRSCSFRSRPSNRTSPTCCASCSCPTAMS